MSFPWANEYKPSNAFTRYLDERLPLPRFVYNAVGAGYPVPRNLNYFWNFGVLAGVALMVQIVTGIVLAMHYAAEGTIAFASVEHIMRDVNAGWFIRYAHANGASMFFIVVYTHIFRGLFYGSYKPPREMVWHLGLVIFLLMMATAFMGYVLPWGQMSFWGAQVITGFFSLHYLLPFVILGVIILHIWALHIPGSSNPTGVEVKSEQDTVPFHPYYTAKDGVGVAAFFLLFASLVFFAPNMLGHPDNYIPANPMSTPAHIVPEWYFWPFYAILRAFTVDFFFIPAKLLGVLAMFASILLLFFLPWLDTSAVRSGHYRPLFRKFFWFGLVPCVIILAWCGGAPAEEPYVIISQIASAYYFAHFLIILPIIARVETPKPLPNSITEAVLANHAGAKLQPAE